MGKKRLVMSLKTPDLATAQARRFDAVAWFNRQVEDARRKVGPSAIVEHGLEWRARLAKLEQGDEATVQAFWGHSAEMRDRDGNPLTPREVAQEHADHALEARADHIRSTVGDAAAELLMDVAAGRATPLLHHLDGWLREGGRSGPYQPRSVRQFRSDLAELAAWAEASGVPKTVEAFTRQVAGRFIQERLAAPGANRKTINRKVSAASSYWVWLEKRGHAPLNPWARQSLPKVRKVAGTGDMRPFTDAELARLLAGGADQELDDAMRVAALTGARIEALYRLTVADCAGGWFVVPPQKKEPGPRRVPVHPALAGIVARRCADKVPSEFLFHEAGPLRPGRERSMAASQRFGRYRQKPGVGVHDRPEGQRQSFVNFHSFRRTFATKAEQAGQPPHIISSVVGHLEGRQGMTLGRYSAGPSDEQLRACVEAVRLPAAQ